MAGPIRFRYTHDTWSESRVEAALYRPLDQQFGATLSNPWFSPPAGYQARRLEMDNGDLALFCWSDDAAYWLGNTVTPEVLWRTDKCTFDEAPYPVARWAQRELLAQLEEEDPWLAAYDHLAWFFLPVFFSKDGRESTRAFFRDHAGGFPDADREDALAFYDELLSSGILDDHRDTMATTLGTSEGLDLVRMRATMAEFTVGKLLVEAGYDPVPEVELGSGHALDFRVEDTLVEVTRPEPPRRRNVGTPAAAVRATVGAKSGGQLSAHPGAFLVVDCTSFRDDEWNSVRAERPEVGHRPSMVIRARPNGTIEAYSHGSLPLDLDAAVEWV